MVEVNEKKVALVVGLLIVIVLGSLLFFKGCFKKEFIDDSNEKIDIYEELEFGKELEFNDTSDTLEKISSVVYRGIVDNLPNPPILELDDVYQVEVGDYSFQLPVVNQDVNSLLVIITYYFKAVNDNEFRKVDSFSVKEIGTYKVDYQVTDSYNQTVNDSILIEVVDQTTPVVEGYIEEYDALTGLISYIPVSSNSIINKPLKIVFSDNDEISYAEYYKAIYESIGGNNTLEQESLMNVIEIDLDEEFYLIEDGEYHIRVYDVSGNYQEYTVTIDCMNPVVSVNYQKINSSSVLVTITLDEEVLMVEGFALSEDKKVLTKIYYQNTIENVVIEDLAGNKIEIPVTVEDILTVKVLQDGIISQSNQLNINDGEISLLVFGSDNYKITYTLDGLSYNYLNDMILDKEGTYYFMVVSNGKILDFYLYISKQDIMD